MQADLPELLASTSGRRVLLQLVSPAACRRALPPEALTALEPPARLRSTAAAPAATPAGAEADQAAVQPDAEQDSSAPDTDAAAPADAPQQVMQCV